MLYIKLKLFSREKQCKQFQEAICFNKKVINKFVFKFSGHFCQNDSPPFSTIKYTFIIVLSVSTVQKLHILSFNIIYYLNFTLTAVIIQWFQCECLLSCNLPEVCICVYRGIWQEFYIVPTRIAWNLKKSRTFFNTCHVDIYEVKHKRNKF